MPITGYRSVFPKDDPILFDGDNGFYGVNMRLDPGLLEPGIAASATNKEFLNGVAKTRRGIQKLVWANSLTYASCLAGRVDTVNDRLVSSAPHRMRTTDPVSLVNGDGTLPGGTSASAFYYARVIDTNTITLHSTATDATANTAKVDLTSSGSGTHRLYLLRPVPFGIVHGAGVFNDADDLEWIIIAADNAVWKCRESNIASSVPLPGGTTISGNIAFVQALNKFLMFRSASLPPLQMSDVGQGFSAITQTTNVIAGATSENPSDGTETIPNSDNALYSANRIFIPYSRDLVAASDFLNYTRYQPVRSVLRINQGSSDKLVTLFKFNDTMILAFKERSIYVLSNVYGDLREVTLDELTRAYGLASKKAVAQVGSDVWFLADRRGVSSVIQTQLNKLQSVDLPVSDAIQPLIERINWSKAGAATAIYHANKFYLAVPIDSARVERANMLAGTETYDSIGHYVVNVQKGRLYHYTPGANEKQLLNGTETLSSEADFTAQSNTITLIHSNSLLADDFNTENSGLSKEGYTGFKNWNVIFGNVDLIGQDYATAPLGPNPPFPPQQLYVDTIGLNLTTAQLMSKTTFTFTNGVAYKLRLKTAGSNAGNTAQLGIQIGALVSDNLTLVSADPLTERVYPFTGNGSSAAIVLTSTSGVIVNNGVLIDDVGLFSGDPSGVAITATIKPVFDGVNNALFVYDFLNRQWSGRWTSEALLIKDFIRHTYNGVSRLFFLSEDGFINLMEEGFEDEVANSNDVIAAAAINDELITRGFTLGSRAPKNWREYEVNISTWAPKFDLTALTEGVMETQLLRSNVTKSSTVYYRPFNAPAYDATNANNDHGTAWREDYSVTLLDASTQIDPGAAGIDVELHQQNVERGRILREGKYCQFIIAGSKGRTEVRNVSLGALPGERQEGPQT